MKKPTKKQLAYWQSLKGNTNGKNNKGNKRPDLVLWNKLHSQKGEKHPRWKGEEAKYCAIHQYITKYKGKASEYKCVDCGKQAEDWSNKDHSYKRELEDYSPRCKKCHIIYDKKYNK